MMTPVYALIVFDEPDREDPDSKEAWSRICKVLSQRTDKTGNGQSRDNPKTIGQAIWEFELARHLSVLVAVLSFAQAHKLSYRVLLLGREPEWLEPNASRIAMLFEQSFGDYREKHA